MKIIKEIVTILFIIVLFVSCSEKKLENNKYYSIVTNEERRFITNNIVYYGLYEPIYEYQLIIEQIYMELYQKFKNIPTTFPRNENKLAIYFIDPDKYTSVYKGNVFASFEKQIGVIIPLNNTYNFKTSTVRHELVHAFTVGSASSKKPRPKWLEEGIAMYFQNGTERIPSINYNVINLDNRLFYDSDIWPKTTTNNNGITRKDYYLQALSIVTFLIEMYGEEEIINIFYTNKKTNRVLQDITNLNRTELFTQYQIFVKGKLQ